MNTQRKLKITYLMSVLKKSEFDCNMWDKEVLKEFAAEILDALNKWEGMAK